MNCDKCGKEFFLCDRIWVCYNTLIGRGKFTQTKNDVVKGICQECFAEVDKDV